MVERVVNDIDEIVRLVRFDGWQNTHAGEREVKMALRKTLLQVPAPPGPGAVREGLRVHQAVLLDGEVHVPSSLTWIDHDAAARERSLRILALFQEKESRDELGLGGVRDAFADLLFPGTSTIQTRLRYMLFVPWIYKWLRGPEGPVGRVRPAGRRGGARSHRRHAQRRRAGSWDSRWSGWPQSQAAAQLRVLGRARLLGDPRHRSLAGPVSPAHRRHLPPARPQSDRDRDRATSGDDRDRTPEPGTVTWHPRLPPPSPEFPRVADFRLTAEEASFLLDPDPAEPSGQPSGPPGAELQAGRGRGPMDASRIWRRSRRTTARSSTTHARSPRSCMVRP